MNELELKARVEKILFDLKQAEKEFHYTMEYLVQRLEDAESVLKGDNQ